MGGDIQQKEQDKTSDKDKDTFIFLHKNISHIYELILNYLNSILPSF
jgi:hypothetical protein